MTPAHWMALALTATFGVALIALAAFVRRRLVRIEDVFRRIEVALDDEIADSEWWREGKPWNDAGEPRA